MSAGSIDRPEAAPVDPGGRVRRWLGRAPTRTLLAVQVLVSAAAAGALLGLPPTGVILLVAPVAVVALVALAVRRFGRAGGTAWRWCGRAPTPVLLAVQAVVTVSAVGALLPAGSAPPGLETGVLVLGVAGTIALWRTAPGAPDEHPGPGDASPRRSRNTWPAWSPPTHRLRELRAGGVAVTLAIAVLLLSVGAIAVATVDHRDGVVVGDEALIALEAKAVPQDRPLIGKVTSAVLYGNLEQPHNPGPMQAWGLWPFVVVLGTSLGAWAFAALVNLGAAGTATLAAFRRGGGRWAAITLLTCLLMFERTAPGGLTSVLNTRIVVLPLFAVLVVAAMVLLGDTAMTVPLVVLASFVVQTHVGYAPVAATATAVALGVAVWRTARRPVAARQALHLVAAAAVGVALWAPPLYDQFAGRGNLAALLRAEVPGAGLGRAGAIVGAMLDPRVAWFRSGEIRPEHFGWMPWGPSLVALLVVWSACWWAWTRRRVHLPLLLLVLACSGAAALTGWVTPPTDTAGEHFFWFRAVTFLTAYVLVLMAVGPSPAPSPHRSGESSSRSSDPSVTLAGATASDTGGPSAKGGRRRWALAGAGALVVLAAVPLTRPPIRNADEVAAIRAVQDLRATVAPLTHDEPPLAIAHRGSWPAVATADGLVTDLRDRGLRVVQVDGPTRLTGHRVLVVTQGVTRPGEPLDRSPRTTRSAEHPDTLPEEVRDWAADHGPIRLAGPGARNLAPVLDGTEPGLCLASFERDPASLLELDAAVVADLYAQRQVVAPALPFDLGARLARWSSERPIELREAPSGNVTDDAPELLLSRSTC